MTALIPSGSRVPPHDLDAEAAVLSAVFLDPETLDAAQGALSPEHFYADANRRVFESMLELSARGQPVDIVAVANTLRERGRLEQVGGGSYLAQIADATPAIANIENHARIVREKHRLRSVIAEAQAIVAEAYAVPEDVVAFVQSAEARLYIAAGEEKAELRARTAKQIMDSCVPEIGRRFAGEVVAGMSTGFRSLDIRIGGLRDERVYVVAARPGMGKTSFATQLMGIVANSSARKRGVYMASLEMPNEQIGERLIAQAAQLDTRKVERGWLTRSEWEKIVESGQGIGAWPMIIDDKAGMTISELRANLRRARRTFEGEFDVELGLVVIDYFQLLGTHDIARWGSSTNDTLEALSKAIVNGIAKEFKVPVVLLSQLNRECEKRPGKRPQLSDLRGSGALEQDAHTIMFLFREDVYREPQEEKDRAADVIVAKCRGGRLGTTTLSYLDYCTKFIDENSEDPNDELTKYRRQAEELGDFVVDNSEQWHP